MASRRKDAMNDMQREQKKQNTASRRAGDGRTRVGARTNGSASQSKQASTAQQGRVRLSAAERLDRTERKDKSASRTTVRHTDNKQIMRRADAVKGENAANRSGKSTPNQKGSDQKPKKVYDPRSSAPIHQVLPFVFLVLGIFFGVCFVLYAVNLSHAEDVIGAVGRGMCRLLFGVLGYGAFTLPLVLISLAVLWRRAVDNGTLGLRLGLTFLFSIVLSMFLHIVIVLAKADPLPAYDIGALYREGAMIGGGGVIGGVLGRALFNALRLVGSSILCVGGLLLLGMFLCGVTPVYVWTAVRYRVRRSREKRDKALATRREISENQKLADAVLSGGLDPDPENGKRRRQTAAENRADPTADDEIGKKTTSGQNGEKGRRRRAFASDEELLPVMTDESIPREQREEPDELPNDTELDMSAVYGTSAMREELRRADEVNSVAKANGFTATDWMRSSGELLEGEGEADVQKPDANISSVEMVSSASAKADVPALPQKEDDRIQQLFVTAEAASKATEPEAPLSRKEKSLDIPVKQSLSEADEYLPENDEDMGMVPVEPEERPYVFPPVDLLKRGDSSTKITPEEIERNMQTLRNVLKSFNINIREMAYSCGPTITRYEVRPESGTRVRQFTLLSDDIALGLAAKSGIRIEAPIPGKPAVGIEVPNDNPATVWLRSLIDTPEFVSSKGTLPVCLGADISGKEVFLDIVKMPHLLIAGATGMGKSVCINCLVTSLMYRYSPADVRLIMVDPKQVEFVPYKDIPHLFVPIITDPKAATAALSAAIDEMEDRFTKIKDMGVRDIRGYNEIAAMDPDVTKLPYLVIIIDELADLMMTASDEVETSICRLAQKARAAGIHLIIGTQRPSVDVVKGTIKSNIPSRIAFTVASQVDSKTILDTAGAEKLIGRGDMIYAPVGAMKPIRVQGAFVSDKEVESIADYIKKNNVPVKYDEQFMKRMTEAAARVGAKKNEGFETDGDATLQSGDEDDKLRAALEVIYDTGRASTSLLQRKLSIGYGRAAKILDALEEQGFIGPQEGSKPRTILISRQDYMERYLNDMDLSGGGDHLDEE